METKFYELLLLIFMLYKSIKYGKSEALYARNEPQPISANSDKITLREILRVLACGVPSTHFDAKMA